MHGVMFAGAIRAGSRATGWDSRSAHALRLILQCCHLTSSSASGGWRPTNWEQAGSGSAAHSCPAHQKLSWSQPSQEEPQL